MSNTLKTLNKTATKTLLSLIDGLPVGGARKLDNAPGAFMAVSVDVLQEAGPYKLVAVAHRFEQNGDLVPDPDMEFLIATVGETVLAYPTAIDQQCGYQRAINLGEGLKIETYRPRAQADLASFANVWMKNIRFQQAA